MKSWETGLDQGIFFLAVKPSLNFSLTLNYKYSYLKPFWNSNWDSPALLADAVTAQPCSQGLNAIPPCASLWRLSSRLPKQYFNKVCNLFVSPENCFFSKIAKTHRCQLVMASKLIVSAAMLPSRKLQRLWRRQRRLRWRRWQRSWQQRQWREQQQHRSQNF